MSYESPGAPPGDDGLSGYSSDSSLLSTASSTVSIGNGIFHEVTRSDTLHANLNEKTLSSVNYCLWIQWKESGEWEAIPRGRMDAGLKQYFDQLVGQQGTSVFVSIIII